MKATPDASTDFSKLRRLAEEKYAQSHAPNTPPVPELELFRLVHELQVHQIELEMQNEELEQARDAAQSWLKRYADLYDFAPVGYFTLTQNGTMKQINLRGSILLGKERAQLVDRQFGLFVYKDSLPVFNSFLADIFASGVKNTCEVMLQRADNEPLWVQFEAVAVDNGHECRAVVIDIHARKLAEIKLQHLSMHDALTGLNNRSYFMESIERLENGRHFPVSILMGDVDRLKETNDLLGHAVGDSMLKRVAQVLTQTFRSEDVLARIGGDEFAVLLPDVDVDAAQHAVLRLNEYLHEHNTNYFTELPLQLSVGVATAKYGDPLIEALKVADANMYCQKRG